MATETKSRTVESGQTDEDFRRVAALDANSEHYGRKYPVDAVVLRWLDQHQRLALISVHMGTKFGSRIDIPYAEFDYPGDPSDPHRLVEAGAKLALMFKETIYLLVDVMERSLVQGADEYVDSDTEGYPIK